MNKHFDDSRYYLSRAGEHAKLGLSEAVEPYAVRLRELVGRESEPEPEPTRLEAVRDGVVNLERNAAGQAREVVGSARATLSRTGADEPAGDR
ncbi:DUF7553 family protein [Natronorubrum sp. FCH18a]|uniref:DUF7553 family protein n=1 Tax=Natronorubrum sp. FCH18a TaxID=3447018 RepID=UPI003F514782